MWAGGGSFPSGASGSEAVGRIFGCGRGGSSGCSGSIGFAGAAPESAAESVGAAAAPSWQSLQTDESTKAKLSTDFGILLLLYCIVNAICVKTAWIRMIQTSSGRVPDPVGCIPSCRIHNKSLIRHKQYRLLFQSTNSPLEHHFNKNILFVHFFNKSSKASIFFMTQNQKKTRLRKTV